MDGFGENVKKILLAGIGAVAATTEKSKDVYKRQVQNVLRRLFQCLERLR